MFDTHNMNVVEYRGLRRDVGRPVWLYKVLINCIYIIFGLYTLPNLKKHSTRKTNKLRRRNRLVQEQVRCNSATLPDTTSYCKPVGHHTINVDTATCVRVQAFHEIRNFAMQAEAAYQLSVSVEPYGLLFPRS